MMNLKMAALIVSLAVFAPVASFAEPSPPPAKAPDRDLRLTGTITSITERVVVVKTSRATVLVPRDLVPKDQIKSKGVVDIHMSKAELDRVKVK